MPVRSHHALGSDAPEARTATILTLMWLVGTLSWWGLAFPPLPQAPPAWLARLQEICFGSEAAGVPKLYGWGALFSGPVAFGLVIWAGWGAEVFSGLAALWRRPLPRALIVLCCTALFAQMAWAGWLTVAASRSAWDPAADIQSEPFPQSYPRLNLPLPKFRLLDRDGNFRADTDLRGRIALVSFAYGHCTTVCPATVATLQTAAHRLTQVRPRIVIITLDAWRDTPSALTAIGDKWGLDDDALLLSGNPIEVDRVLDEFRVARTRNGQTGEIDHVALTYVVDTEGRIAYALNAPNPSWLEAAARRVAATGGSRLISCCDEGTDAYVPCSAFSKCAGASTLMFLPVLDPARTQVLASSRQLERATRRSSFCSC